MNVPFVPSRSDVSTAEVPDGGIPPGSTGKGPLRTKRRHRKRRRPIAFSQDKSKRRSSFGHINKVVMRPPVAHAAPKFSVQSFFATTPPTNQSTDCDVTTTDDANPTIMHSGCSYATLLGSISPILASLTPMVDKTLLTQELHRALPPEVTQLQTLPVIQTRFNTFDNAVSEAVFNLRVSEGTFLTDAGLLLGEHQRQRRRQCARLHDYIQHSSNDRHQKLLSVRQSMLKTAKIPANKNLVRHSYKAATTYKREIHSVLRAGILHERDSAAVPHYEGKYPHLGPVFSARDDLRRSKQWRRFITKHLNMPQHDWHEEDRTRAVTDPPFLARLKQQFLNSVARETRQAYVQKERLREDDYLKQPCSVFVDSGASYSYMPAHMIDFLDAGSFYTSQAGSVALPDGSLSKIEGHGSYHGLPVRIISGLSDILISVSQLVTMFPNWECSFSDTSVHMFIPARRKQTLKVFGKLHLGNLLYPSSLAQIVTLLNHIRMTDARNVSTDERAFKFMEIPARDAVLGLHNSLMHSRTILQQIKKGHLLGADFMRKCSHYHRLDDFGICPACCKAKARRSKPLTVSTRHPAKVFGERLHCDFQGRVSKAGSMSHKPTIILVVVDEASRYTFRRPIRARTDFKATMLQIRHEMTIINKRVTAHRRGLVDAAGLIRIQQIHIDNDSVARTSSDDLTGFKAWCQERLGANSVTYSPPRTQALNGIAERAGDMTVQDIKTALYNSTLDLKWWDRACIQSEFVKTINIKAQF